MIEDSSYAKIAESVYNVEPQMAREKLQEVVVQNSIIEDETTENIFQVLKTEDHPFNGMQAMAVAPVVNGKADTSEIVLAYAGTNFKDKHDVDTDLQMIGIGKTETLQTGYKRLLSVPIPFTGHQTESQAKTALAFAREVKQIYPDAHFTTTGHSLGESLAMYVALKEGYQNIGYNGPDIHRMISRDELQYMREHSDQFLNYRNPYDPIGGITGNRTQSAHRVKASEGLFNPVVITSSYHALSNWQHNERGQVLDCQGQVASYSRAAYLEASLLSLQNDREQGSLALSRDQELTRTAEKTADRTEPIRAEQTAAASKGKSPLSSPESGTQPKKILSREGEQVQAVQDSRKLPETHTVSEAKTKQSQIRSDKMAPSGSGLTMEEHKAVQKSLKDYAKKHPEVLPKRGRDREKGEQAERG
ncbi:hypothetical protein [Streptococcus dentiloxodontae]